MYFGMASFIFEVKENVERDKREENVQANQTDYTRAVGAKYTPPSSLLMRPEIRYFRQVLRVRGKPGFLPSELGPFPPH